MLSFKLYFSIIFSLLLISCSNMQFNNLSNIDKEYSVVNIKFNVDNEDLKRKVINELVSSNITIDKNSSNLLVINNYYNDSVDVSLIESGQRIQGANTTFINAVLYIQNNSFYINESVTDNIFHNSKSPLADIRAKTLIDDHRLQLAAKTLANKLLQILEINHPAKK